MSLSSQTTNDRFFQLVRHPLKMRLFLLSNLPAAYFAGLKLLSADEARAEVSIRYGWFTKNPFRSTYFACLSMAAELSTGVLAMAQVYGRKPKVSMLVVETSAKFYKKATGRTRFTCADGAAIQAAVGSAVATGEGQTVRVLSTGVNEGGEVVAEFWFTWSFRAKK